MKINHLQDIYVKDQIRSYQFLVKGASNIWKCMVKYFPLLGKWVGSKVGNGYKLQVGEDPWVKCIEIFNHEDELKGSLRIQCIKNHCDISLKGEE